MKESISRDLLNQTEEKIKEILDSDINPSNVEHLYKLIDIYKDAKEVESMNYGNYGNYGEYGRGRRAGYDSYGRGGSYGYGNYGEGSYGRRGYDAKYKGDEELDRMAGEYGRYMESRSRYGAGEETDKSFHYMVKALEDFIKVLEEEAEGPQQRQQLNEALQNAMR